MNQAQVNSTGASKGSLKSYVTGYILSVVLTAAAFALVTSGTLPHSAIWFGIFGAAALQILVHLHYFLHLDTSSEARWNVLALLFAVLIMVIFVLGTLWIMYNLHSRMM